MFGAGGQENRQEPGAHDPIRIQHLQPEGFGIVPVATRVTIYSNENLARARLDNTAKVRIPQHCCHDFCIDRDVENLGQLLPGVKLYEITRTARGLPPDGRQMCWAPT
jgi:hypothetical protein